LFLVCSYFAGIWLVVGLRTLSVCVHWSAVLQQEGGNEWADDWFQSADPRAWNVRGRLVKFLKRLLGQVHRTSDVTNMFVM